jgi:hypothetical protein
MLFLLWHHNTEGTTINAIRQMPEYRPSSVNREHESTDLPGGQLPAHITNWHNRGNATAEIGSSSPAPADAVPARSIFPRFVFPSLFLPVGEISGRRKYAYCYRQRAGCCYRTAAGGCQFQAVADIHLPFILPTPQQRAGNTDRYLSNADQGTQLAHFWTEVYSRIRFSSTPIEVQANTRMIQWHASFVPRFLTIVTINFTVTLKAKPINPVASAIACIFIIFTTHVHIHHYTYAANQATIACTCTVFPT